MTYYDVLLFLHIGAVTVWLGSAFFLQMLVFRAAKSDDGGLMQGLAGNSGWLAQRIFIPTSLAVLVLGVLLTIEGPWGFGDLSVVHGHAGYAFSFLVGILFLEPEGKRIAAAMDAGDPGRAGFHIGRINTVSRIELVVLYLVVAAMAFKPTGDDTGTLVIGAAVLLAALAFWGPKLRPATA
jgi:uncharacterized membrane protein